MPTVQPTMQSFRISDALRCTLLNAPRGPNLACPRECLSGESPQRQSALLWKNAVLQPKDRVALARWSGIRLGGLVSARTRSGNRAWEIDGFYLTGRHNGSTTNYNGRPDSPVLSDSDSLELLEQLIVAVGWRFAERVFLRLPVDDPALKLARRSGFFPCFTETLLEGYGGRAADPVNNSPRPGLADPAIPGGSAAAELRPRLPQDEYALFLLFCASAPAKVREALGLTFDQWRDAREPHFGKNPGGSRQSGVQDWVIECKDRIVGWVGINARRSGVDAEVEVMVHPDYPEALPQLMTVALARPGRQRWLTPDYQETVGLRLHRCGFREVAQYTMLVKLVATPVLCHGMAPVEA